MGDLRTCPPEEFLDVLARCSLNEKRALIEQLSEIRNERSVAILAELAQGDSWYLRDLAGRGLARIGDPAVPALLVLVRSGLWYTRATAARALGRAAVAESLPILVRMLADTNQTVQGACLASIADLVREGLARETARLFWNEGAHRAKDLGRVLMAVHPEEGREVNDLLADPATFLHDDAADAAVEEAGEDASLAGRKNA
jgi:HEAT repeat protein